MPEEASRSDNAYVTRAEANHVADRAAKGAAEGAVSRLCDRLGVDPDSRESVEDTRDVIAWAKQARDGQRALKDSARKGAAKAAGGSLMLGVLYVLWWVLQAFSKSKGGP